MSENTVNDSGMTREAMVLQALGAASMCWDHPERAGTFHDTEAKAITEKLVAALDRFKPELGAAITRQLLNELTARNGGGGLEHRTPDRAELP